MQEAREKRKRGEVNEKWGEKERPPLLNEPFSFLAALDDRLFFPFSFSCACNTRPPWLTTLAKMLNTRDIFLRCCHHLTRNWQACRATENGFRVQLLARQVRAVTSAHLRMKIT